jgi:hypothetical protein
MMKTDKPAPKLTLKKETVKKLTTKTGVQAGGTRYSGNANCAVSSV